MDLSGSNCQTTATSVSYSIHHNSSTIHYPPITLSTASSHPLPVKTNSTHSSLLLQVSFSFDLQSMSHAYTSFPPQSSTSRSPSLSSRSSVPVASSPSRPSWSTSLDTDSSCTDRSPSPQAALTRCARRHTPKQSGSSRHAPLSPGLQSAFRFVETRNLPRTHLRFSKLVDVVAKQHPLISTRVPQALWSSSQLSNHISQFYPDSSIRESVSTFMFPSLALSSAEPFVPWLGLAAQWWEPRERTSSCLEVGTSLGIRTEGIVVTEVAGDFVEVAQVGVKILVVKVSAINRLRGVSYT